MLQNDPQGNVIEASFQVYPRVLDDLIPSALHIVEQYAKNPIDEDHGRLKARLRPMRGVKRHRSARILAAGHAFVQNLRRGHYDIAVGVHPPPAPHRRLRNHHLTSGASGSSAPSCPGMALRNSAAGRCGWPWLVPLEALIDSQSWLLAWWLEGVVR
jgi:hypothetical protein